MLRSEALEQIERLEAENAQLRARLASFRPFLDAAAAFCAALRDHKSPTSPEQAEQAAIARVEHGASPENRH